jgi:hypothetical protein
MALAVSSQVMGRLVQDHTGGNGPAASRIFFLFVPKFFPPPYRPLRTQHLILHLFRFFSDQLLHFSQRNFTCGNRGYL